MSEAVTFPDGWKRDVLINLAEYHNGAAFKANHWAKDGLPIIRIEQINNPDSETDKFNGMVLPSNFIDSGDLIFSWSATLKVVIWKHGPAVLNQHLYKVVSKPIIQKELLRHILDFHMDRLSGQSQGSTMKHVTRKELSKFRVFYPGEKHEQKKIAHILQTIDQAIEKTQALIEKYQQIKAGLMHDLFTRGIAPNGQLRPPRDQAPELYQQTPIGWIPKEWEFAPIGKYVKSAQYGISTSLEGGATGIPVLRMNNIQSNSFDVSELKYSRDPEAYKVKLSAGDVLYNRTNSIEHVGKTAIWKDELAECSFASYLVRLNLITETICPEYFSHWMSRVSSQNALRVYATPGVQQVNINPTNLQRVIISLPTSTDEQSEIARRIDSLDNRVEQDKFLVAKLQKQKSGLMHDLLTGKVPVKVEPKAEAEISA